MRWYKKLLAVLILICFLLQGCSFSSNNKSSTPASEKASSSGNNAKTSGAFDSVFKNTPDAKIVADFTSPNVSAKTGDFGNAKFTVDNSKTVSGDFTADGKDLTLTLNTNDGLKWTLTIPGNALPEEEKITMTALSNVKSDTFKGDFGGVMLYPDGTRFLVPATLTVTGPSIFKESLILTGNQDGSNIDLAYNDENKDGSASAKLMHFSSGFVPRGQTKAPPDPAMKARYKQILLDNIEMAKKIVNDKNLFVPVPPSISMKSKECRNLSDAQANTEKEAESKFLKDFENPERAVINQLVNSIRACELMGAAEDADITNGLSYVHGLFSRLLKKSDVLIQTYGNSQNPSDIKEKLLASSDAILPAARGYDLTALGDVKYAGSEYLEKLSSWALKAAHKYEDDISQKHEYSAQCAVLYAYYLARFNGDKTEQMVAEMAKIMNFEIDFDATTKMSGGSNGKMEFNIKGQVPNIPIKIVKGDAELKSGSGEHVSYSLPAGMKLEMPGKFSPKAMFNRFISCPKRDVPGSLDITFGLGNCIEKITPPNGQGFAAALVAAAFGGVYLNTKNADNNETSTLEKAEKDALANLNPLEMGKIKVKNDQSESDSFAIYHFENLNIQDSNETAAQQTFAKNNGGISTIIKFTVVHKPKK